jgi:hypothetical protein
LAKSSSTARIAIAAARLTISLVAAWPLSPIRAWIALKWLGVKAMIERGSAAGKAWIVELKAPIESPAIPTTMSSRSRKRLSPTIRRIRKDRGVSNGFSSAATERNAFSGGIGAVHFSRKRHFSPTLVKKTFDEKESRSYVPRHSDRP